MRPCCAFAKRLSRVASLQQYFAFRCVYWGGGPEKDRANPGMSRGSNRGILRGTNSRGLLERIGISFETVKKRSIKELSPDRALIPRRSARSSVDSTPATASSCRR